MYHFYHGSKLNSSQSEEITLEEDIEESCHILSNPKSSRTVTASFSKDQLYCIEIYILDFLLATMTLTIKIWSSSANSASMDDRLRDALNEHLKSSGSLTFSHWKQTWKDGYSNQHTGGQDTATYIFHCLLVVSIYQLLHCNSILPVSFRQFLNSRQCFIHRAAQLSFLPFFLTFFYHQRCRYSCSWLVCGFPKSKQAIYVNVSDTIK